ncbi:hypothetical protein SAMN04244560_02158 [Thermoanaerobacter thermohydrosulfuricus]|uniref:Uncharacterized protein n=1 Tax=Thermoanaerobacter thermohydrosulfuricus TaxID=1516 RepID=A0A1G7TBV1_THETY|nr:hypothetical protein SAMN04244560_02158 [Thermoanaerobacter thermohydrosulfuricus]
MQTHPPQFSLLSGSCSSDRDFACRFLQIPPHDGHPCGSASGSHYQAHSGLSPPSYRPCRAHNKKASQRGFSLSTKLFSLKEAFCIVRSRVTKRLNISFPSDSGRVPGTFGIHALRCPPPPSLASAMPPFLGLAKFSCRFVTSRLAYAKCLIYKKVLSTVWRLTKRLFI